MTRATLLIGLDIGGTKTKAGAVAIGSGALDAGRIVAAEQMPTPPEPVGRFYDAMAELVRRVRARLGEADGVLLPLVGVAHPGRFLPDGTLARGTTPNLGQVPHQFDGVSPSQELAARLVMRVFAENDAVAQMRFGLDALLRDPRIHPRLVGQTVVYLGPGTVMGGGVARVSADGVVQPVTDGHFFDLQVPGWGDGTLTAEELFTGSAVARRIAQANVTLPEPILPARGERLTELLADPRAPESQRELARTIADEEGDILARLIETIHAGTIVKVRLERAPDGAVIRHVDEPDRVWSHEDRDVVRGATRFMLGGSVGIDPVRGGHIRRRALELLRKRGYGAIDIFQIPVASADAGLLGSVLAIPGAAV